MKYDTTVNHPAAQASAAYIARQIDVQGSVILDPAATVTLATAYLDLHARFDPAFIAATNNLIARFNRPDQPDDLTATLVDAWRRLTDGMFP